MAGPAFLMAHTFSVNASGIQGSEELSPRTQRSPCPNTSRQYVSGLVFESSGRSTLKVYAAAVAAFHAPLYVEPLGRHQLFMCFLRGAWRMRPATCSIVPNWDLAVVL